MLGNPSLLNTGSLTLISDYGFQTYIAGTTDHA
jgi:hypothetical protein